VQVPHVITCLAIYQLSAIRLSRSGERLPFYDLRGCWFETVHPHQTSGVWQTCDAARSVVVTLVTVRRRESLMIHSNQVLLCAPQPPILQGECETKCNADVGSGRPSSNGSDRSALSSSCATRGKAARSNGAQSVHGRIDQLRRVVRAPAGHAEVMRTTVRCR